MFIILCALPITNLIHSDLATFGYFVITIHESSNSMSKSMFMACSSTGNISVSDAVLLQSVMDWYNEDKANVDRFLAVVRRKSPISLRVIDWLVTNYSKTNTVIIKSKGVPRDLNRDYQKNLSAHNKKNMDPFARRNKIKIVLYGTQERFSTVGQLNFFRWFYKNHVNLFLKESREVVEKHMKEFEGKDKGSTVRGRRTFNVNSFSGRFRMTF